MNHVDWTLRKAVIATIVAVTALVAVRGVGVAHSDAIDAGWRSQPTTDTISARLVARGDSVFHGKAGGGTCMACHQAGGKGMQGLAPDLRDKSWLHGDGSRASIADIIRKGVPKPRQSAAPMLPGGGARLSPSDIDAVAAYVYALSHPEAVRK